MEQTLNRDDIVGKAIHCVYRSEWDEHADGVGGCAAFVETTDGVLFVLHGVDFGTVEPVPTIDPRTTPLIPEEWINDQCRGRAILEVLASRYWPTIGLLMDGMKLLVVTDDCTPRRVGPCVLDVGTVYDVGDYVPYWSRILPIT